MKYLAYTFSLLFIINTLFAQHAHDQNRDSKIFIGGFGEVHYNYEKPEGGEEEKMLDFHRFVLALGHEFNEEWSVTAEIELEHNLVEEGQGELVLEQAYLDYHMSDLLGFKAGIIFTAVGLMNEMHEPPLFFGVERPEYNQNIIPIGWFGNGIGLYGAYEGFSYKFNIMEGLNLDGFSLDSGIRGGLQKGHKADAENLLYNASVGYSFMPGFQVGASAVFNTATGDSTEADVTLFEVHGRYEHNNIHASFEAASISYSDYVVEGSHGFYIDLGYDIKDILNVEWMVIPFVRYSDYNTVNSSEGDAISEDLYHYTKWAAGVSVKPLEHIVFKIDYGQRELQYDNTKTDLLNLGVGYVF